MTNIAQVAVGVINLIEDWRFIYSIAANAMYAVEALQLFEKSSNVNILSGSNLTNSLVVQVTAAASYGYLIIKVS